MIAYKETDRSRDGHRRVEFDGEAEFGEAPDEAAGLRVGAAAIEVSSAEILIECAVFEHVIGRRDDRGGNGADGFLRPASSAQPHELRVEVGGLSARRGPAALNERGL